MCYVIAKNAYKEGSVAFQTEHGPELVALKRKTGELVDESQIQLVTVSRLSAFEEYEPYTIVKSEDEFIKAAMAL